MKKDYNHSRQSSSALTIIFKVLRFLCLATALLALSHADSSADIDSLKTSVYLLKSANKKTCGSAFLMKDNTLVTANHVIQNLIQQNHETGISNIEILIADYTGKEKPYSLPPSNITSIGSLDAAKLTIFDLKAERSFDASQLNIPVQKTTNQVTAMGFKDCSEFKTIKGQITDDSPIWSETTLRGYFGMSGGPVFNQKDEFVGIVDQASSISGGSSGRIFGSGFDLRITNAQALSVLFIDDPKESLIREASLINSSYRKVILQLNSFARLLKSLEFFSQKRLFIERLSHYPDLTPDLTPFLRNETGVSIITGDRTSPPSQLDEALHELAIYNAFETYGNFSGNSLEKNTYNLELEKLETSSFSQEFKNRIKEFINIAVIQAYPGYEAMAVSSLMLLMPIVLILIIWGFTIGFTWGTYKKGLVSKLWVTFVVAFLLWPFSFIIYLMRVKR